MTHKEFIKLQSELDKSGVATDIKRVGPKNYNCIVNFEIVKNYKSRASAKQYFIKMYKTINMDIHPKHSSEIGREETKSQGPEKENISGGDSSEGGGSIG